MNKKAGRYIKPEKLKNFLDNNNKEDLTPPVKRDSISTAEKQQQKNKIELRVQNVNDENSKISENNRQESFADSSDDEEEDDDNQVSQSDKKSQYHHNPSRVQTIATVQPRSDRAAASIGRHRASTFDPKTLKRMMVGKVESLKPDDQIEKEFEERTPTDIKFLVKCTENVGFFKKYDEETHRECLAKMYHVHLKQGDPCISFGEFGETFWVTLKGKVGILVPIEKEITDKNGEVRKEKVLTRVAGQGAGYAFGELALLERKPRAATILCEDDCDFAVLDKTPFQQILLQKEEKRLYAEVNFLKNIKIFSQWAYNSVRSLFMYFQMKTYTRGQVVCRQSDPADCMFIIRAGEFKVSYKAHYETKEGEVLSPEHGIVKKYMKKRATTRDVELSILGPSEIIGVEDLLEDRPRSHTVVCESQTALILQIHKKEAKKFIFDEESAKVWLKEYLESKSKVQGNRIEHIHQNTRKFQPLLMRTASEGSKKSNDFNYKSPFGDQATELSNALRYYRHKRPEHHQITQTLNSQREDSPPRTFESNLHTEPTDHHGKESNRLKLPQDGWSSADRYSLLESTVQATESTTGSALLSQPVRTSPHKRSATQPVDLNKGREEEQGSFRLSITEKVFKAYNDSIKLRRTNKEDRFANLISKPMPLLPHRLGESRLTDLINTSTDSRSRAGRLRESIGREDHIKNVSTLSYSSSTSKLELVVTNSAEKPLISKSFHLKLHQAFPALPTNRMSLDSKITAQTSRFHPRTDLETSKNHEYYMKSRKELIDRIAEIKERLDFRDQIDQDLFLFSKRNLGGGIGQTLYNRAIISSFSTNQPEKQDSPISLRLRDRLNKIQKNAKSKNAANAELPEKVEPVNQSASSIILKANLIHGTKTDPDSARTPPKGRPTFKQQNSDIQSIKVVGQATNSNSLKLNLKSDMETPIKVTDRFFPLIENRDSN